MFEDISPDLELVRDVSAGEWIVSSLRPWDRDRIRLWSFMPEGFEAYARVFHPLLYGERYGTDVQRSWASVAAERGVTLTPDISIFEVLPPYPDDALAHPNHSPPEGDLPKEVCGPLVNVLDRHTTSQGTCWFGVWSGLGVLTTSTPLYAAPGPSRKERKALHALQEDEDAALRAIPKLECGHGRDHLLFKGPLRTACSIHRHGWVSPALWWPEDRAWIVVTEIDGVCTYVGGSREAIDSVLASDLESIEVTLDVHMS